MSADSLTLKELHFYLPSGNPPGVSKRRNSSDSPLNMVCVCVPNDMMFNYEESTCRISFNSVSSDTSLKIK